MGTKQNFFSAVKNLKLHENFKFEPIEAHSVIFLLKKIQQQNWMLAFPFGFICTRKAIQS